VVNTAVSRINLPAKLRIRLRSQRADGAFLDSGDIYGHLVPVETGKPLIGSMMLSEPEKDSCRVREIESGNKSENNWRENQI
jgi:hypothetical protein